MSMNDLRNGGRSVLIAAPDPLSVVSLAACKAALGIVSTTQDAMITAAIGAVVAELDPAFGGWLGRALGVQTWELQLLSFYDHRLAWRRYCADAIVLPYPPLITVTSVKYLDADGVDRTLALGTGYRVFGLGSLGKQYLAPAYGGSWPVARCDEASVRIQFSCGYDGATNKLPPSINAAVALGVRALLAVSERNLFLSEDMVEGVGTKKYIVGSGAGDVVKAAIGQLLVNLSITAL